MQATGGSPGLNGTPGSPGGGSANQSGGVPFYPPMMGGGQGGAGEKPQERERQTWLSEDEEIWGTSVGVGHGVIGRPDDEEFEAEEITLVGPVRGRRRAETRRPRPAEQETEQRAERETRPQVGGEVGTKTEATGGEESTAAST
jgi:hypothetical protein